VGRTTLVDTVPMGYGRPRGDATAYPMDESMTYRPTVIEPGNVGRGGGRRVITSQETHSREELPIILKLKSSLQPLSHIQNNQTCCQMSID